MKTSVSVPVLLLLTDGYDNGEPHWQIYEDGSLMFSIMYRPVDVPKSARYNQISYSKPVFTAGSLGRWHHLAVTYDNTSGEVIQYFDAQEVSREISPLHQPARPITFGPCEIGNWGLPTQNHQSPIRNPNRAIDEFAIYQSVLSPIEIRQQFETGKPEQQQSPPFFSPSGLLRPHRLPKLAAVCLIFRRYLRVPA